VSHLNQGRFGGLGRRRGGHVQRRVQVEVPGVGVSATLDEQLDDVDGRKDADRVSADGRAGGRFYETVSAEIYGQNEACNYDLIGTTLKYRDYSL
jgi:hypothetical protein